MKQRVIGPILLALIATQAVAEPGDSWMEIVSASNAGSFDAEVFVDAAGSRVGAYQLTLVYNADAGIQVDKNRGSYGGVSAGADGFAAAVNTTVPGRVTVNGFDLVGRPGKEQTHLVTVHFVGGSPAAGDLHLMIDTLATEQGVAIGH